MVLNSPAKRVVLELRKTASKSATGSWVPMETTTSFKLFLKDNQKMGSLISSPQFCRPM